MRGKLRVFWDRLSGPLLLAFLTASVTLILLIVLSVVLGGENQRHREAQRCSAALLHDMLIDGLDLSTDKYPPVNTEGLDCSINHIPIEAHE